jgi:hypothetical protein
MEGEFAPRFRTDPLLGKVLKRGREENPHNSATHRPNWMWVADSYSSHDFRSSHKWHGSIYQPSRYGKRERSGKISPDFDGGRTRFNVETLHPTPQLSIRSDDPARAKNSGGWIGAVRKPGYLNPLFLANHWSVGDGVFCSSTPSPQPIDWDRATGAAS